MDTSRQKITFGQLFTVSVPNAGEKEFVVSNFHDQPFDGMKCEIKNSTSYPPPIPFTTDPQSGVIKLKFDPRIPANTGLELIVYAQQYTKPADVIEKTVLLDGAKTAEAVKTGASATWMAIKRAFYGFIALSFIFFLIKGTPFGNFMIDMWSRLNAAKVIQMADELDPRILTNRHPVYESAAFTEYNALYKRNFGSLKDLKELYRFVGNGFFVTKDLIKNTDGSFMLLTKSEASEHCSDLAGHLLSTEELLAYLAGQYLTVENFMWPVSLRANIPEWSRTNESWDNYFLYLKNALNPIEDEKPTANNFVVADDGDVKAAFRCAFTENIFLPAR